MSAKPVPELIDGLIRFKIRDIKSNQSTEHEIDALVLQLACEECVKKHNLEVNENGNYIHTAAFLFDLAKQIADLGVTGCTPTVAHQLWCATSSYIDELKKSISDRQNSHFGSEAQEQAEEN